MTLAIIERIVPAKSKVRLESLRIAKRMARDLNDFAKQNQLQIIGRNNLIARIFGHESFDALAAFIDEQPASVTDWEAPIQEVGERIEEYLRILVASGFEMDSAVLALRTLGTDGWWSFEKLHQKWIEENATSVEEEKTPPPRRRRPMRSHMPARRINSSNASP